MIGLLDVFAMALSAREQAGTSPIIAHDITPTDEISRNRKNKKKRTSWKSDEATKWVAEDPCFSQDSKRRMVRQIVALNCLLSYLLNTCY